MSRGCPLAYGFAHSLLAFLANQPVTTFCRSVGDGLDRFVQRAFVFQAPALPFAVGVIAPVKAVPLEDVDQVGQVLGRRIARRGADGGELADIHVDAVLGRTR